VKRSRRRTELSRGRAIALDDINLSACAREVPAGAYVESAALPRDPVGSGSPHARTHAREGRRTSACYYIAVLLARLDVDWMENRAFLRKRESLVENLRDRKHVSFLRFLSFFLPLSRSRNSLT